MTREKDKDEDRLDTLISQAVGLGKIEFDRQKWLDRLATQPQQSSRIGTRVKDTKRHTLGTIWRKIMESKATRYSAAATILIAAALVLSDPLGLFGGRHGVALAEVVERMNEVQTIMHKERRIYYEVGKDEPMFRTNVVQYLSCERGIVDEQYDEAGNLTGRAYLLKNPPQITIVLVEQKKYLKFPLNESGVRLINNLTPKAIVEYFRAGDCRDLGHRHVDGHDVEGFETSSAELLPFPEQYRFLFPIKDIRWQFWIDKDLPLPVAADVEVTTGRGLLTLFKNLRITCHDYDMQYDPNLPATLFDPNIPADYTPIDLGSAVTPKAAWLGVGALPALGFIAYRRRHPRRCSASGIQNR